MQYDIDGGNITVIVGEEARLDVPTALNYIKSGQAEIGETVDAGIDAFDLNAANKTTAYDNNASAKLAAYNDNAKDKTNAFNLNASGKTGDFNDNYTLKKAAVDASADAAAASATLAQQWAVKMDGKVADEDYSAKYYADLAAQSAGATGANTDLSNLTPTGEAKFTAKQDVIDADHKLSYNYLSDTPDLSAYVTTNTAQTITGAKTIANNANPNFIIQDTRYAYNDSQSANVYWGIDFHDKNGQRVGKVEPYYIGSGAIGMNLSVGTVVNGNISYGALTIEIDANGQATTKAPTPTETTTTTGKQIATTGWVNSIGNNVLHRTDYETYTGIKSNQITLDLSQHNYVRTNDFHIMNLDQTVAPQIRQEIYTNILEDKNSNYFSWITTYYNTNKGTETVLSARCKNSNNTSNVTANLFLTANPDGTTYAEAPASDVNGSIVTTVNKSKAANGYFQLGNGLIVQWGTSQATSEAGTVTLPKAFTSTNYAVVINDVMATVPDSTGSNANLVGWGVVSARTTTNFKAFLCNYENSSWWKCGWTGRTFTWIAIGY